MDSNNTNGVATDIVTYEGEQYKAIPYAPKYYVSRSGQVLSKKGRQPRIIKPESTRVYYRAVLRIGGCNVHYAVHRLVAEMYLPKPLNPTGEELEVHHVNYDSKDNRVENLIWLPRSVHRALHIEYRKQQRLLQQQGQQQPQARKPRKRKVA